MTKEPRFTMLPPYITTTPPEEVVSWLHTIGELLPHLDPSSGIVVTLVYDGDPTGEVIINALGLDK